MTASRTPSRPARVAAAFTLLLAVTLASTACGNDGKSLRTPERGATAPLRTTSTTAQSGTAPIDPNLLSLTSPAFDAGGALPDDLTCYGEGSSPALAWAALPEGTVQVAIVVLDQDADLFAHWVVGGLDPAIAAIPEGAVPDSAIETLNGDGTPGWTPFCPPEGETHTYEFTLHALSEPAALTPDMAATDAIALLDATPGWRAVVTATATGE